MIQRIQSLYLLIASVVTGTLIKIPILSFKTEKEVSVADFKGIYDFATREYLSFNYISLGLFVIIIGLPLITIFIYKKRKIQMRLCTYSIMFTILFLVDIAYFIYMIYKDQTVEVGFELGSVLPIIAIVLLILAKRNISKDEELVKSVDRIR